MATKNSKSKTTKNKKRSYTTKAQGGDGSKTVN